MIAFDGRLSEKDGLVSTYLFAFRTQCKVCIGCRIKGIYGCNKAIYPLFIHMSILVLEYDQQSNFENKIAADECCHMNNIELYIYSHVYINTIN
jgi:hypothetical protein